ncbi:MAG: T9SS type A sorting domain-containing protein [candidate division Zixibacteria bacterium]|nr:T9SS type A sorting domain-containing protein [Candidatus Tariuqbacter arcticus]
MKQSVCLLVVLTIVSISFGQMWEVGNFAVPSNDNCRHLRAYGDCCFICKYDDILMVADVIEPCNPFVGDSLWLDFPCYFTIAENTLYASGGSCTYTVLIFNIENLPEITPVGETIATINAADLEARGDFLYVCDYIGNIFVYDISDRFTPVALNIVQTGGSAYGIKLSENYLYAGIACEGLEIYDISIPESPELVSFLPLDCGIYPMVNKDNDYVYMATYSDGYLIIDVSNPTNPEIISTINHAGFDRYLELSNDRLFLGNWSSGTIMYDISRVDEPQYICSIPALISGTMDLAVAGKYLYVADLSHFRVFEYEKPPDGYYRSGRTEFMWIDITLIGDLWALGDDTFTPHIEIGFDFPFYDNIYDELFVCSNGFIAFNNFSPSYWDTPIPCDTQPNDIIAPFWDNFNPTGSPMNVYTKLLENPMCFVIEFVDMPRVGAVNEFETFEVILFPNGDIIFQYPTVVDASSATAGIENETGTRGTQLLHNYTTSIPDSIAIGFRRMGITEGNRVEIFEFAEDFVDFEEYDNSEEFDNFPQTEAIPSELAVSASPNPFNPNTTVSYQLPQAGIVTISAYNVLGRREAVLVDGYRNAGAHSVEWNASNLSSGIYFILIQANGNSHTLRTLLMR